MYDWTHNYVLEAIVPSYFLPAKKFNIMRSQREDHVEVFSLMHFTNQLCLAFSLHVGKSFPALCWNSPTPPPTHTNTPTQWDIAGQDRYSSLSSDLPFIQYRNVHGILLVCDVTDGVREPSFNYASVCAYGTVLVCLCVFNDQWSASIGF